MKYIKTYIAAFFTCLVLSSPAQAQDGTPVNRDSIMLKGMRQMQKNLLLTDLQVGALIKLTKTYEEKLKGNAFEKKEPELRKKQLADHYTQYRKGIEKILTSQQWMQYQAIEIKRREALQRQAIDKKMRIVPGEIRN